METYIVVAHHEPSDSWSMVQEQKNHHIQTLELALHIYIEAREKNKENPDISISVWKKVI